jgi:outer membrane lipoprotein carrier protein
MLIRFLLMLCLSLVTTLNFAASNNGTAALDALLQSFNRLSANFSQTTQGTDGRILQEAQGNMALARPNQFRWYTLKPTKQLIVMNATKLWVYDVDLEQVSVRPVRGTNQDTPAMLLSGSIQDIEKYYRIELTHHDANTDVFTLSPLKKEGLFRRLTMVFEHQQLSNMAFADNLGQIIRISFSKVVKNPTLPASQFQFKPPAGVDVIGAKS